MARFMAPAAVTPLRVLHAGSSSFVNELSEDLSRDRSADLTKVPTTRGSSYLAQRSFEGRYACTFVFLTYLAPLANIPSTVYTWVVESSSVCVKYDVYFSSL